MANSGDRKHSDMTGDAPARSSSKGSENLKARIARANTEMTQSTAELRTTSAENKPGDHLHHSSEAHLALALEAAGMATWDWDSTSDVFHCSDQLGPMMGMRPSEQYPSYEEFLAAIHEEDRESFIQAVRQVLEEHTEFTLEFRILWPDGSVHWHVSKGRTFSNQPGRLIGVQMDISQHKQTEQSRYHWLNRIVVAQEEERRRVSRELHDQMGQNLAALIVGLEALKSNFMESPAALEGVRELQELVNRLSQKVHSLAWELRPPALDDLGLHTALERFVEQWSERSGVAADWYITGFQSRLPSPIETTLYRIVQEALTNILKHAQATRVSLIIRASAEEVTAIIEDDGKGFDAEFIMQSLAPHYKLGLVGMRERVLLVKGTLDIESVLNYGTTVYVRIPLNQA